MFWKLWKYEIKCSYREHLLMYAGLLISCFFINTSNNILNSILGFVYAIMIVLTIVMTMVIVIRNFSQSMFKRAGYLTMTLPVSMKKIMIVKILNASIWLILSYLMIIISVLVLGSRFYEGSAIAIIDALVGVFQNYGFDIAIEILNLTISLIEMIVMIYAIMVFTNTGYVRKYRGAIAVAIFIGLNLLINFMDGFLFQGFIGTEFNFAISASHSSFGFNAGQTTIFRIVENLVLIAIFYFGSSYILDHKLELE